MKKTFILYLSLSLFIVVSACALFRQTPAIEGEYWLSSVSKHKIIITNGYNVLEEMFATNYTTSDIANFDIYIWDYTNYNTGFYSNETYWQYLDGDFYFILDETNKTLICRGSFINQSVGMMLTNRYILNDFSLTLMFCYEELEISETTNRYIIYMTNVFTRYEN